MTNAAEEAKLMTPALPEGGRAGIADGILEYLAVVDDGIYLRAERFRRAVLRY